MRWDSLNEFLAFVDLAKLSPVQRVAYLAYWYSSQVEMAGHRDYFLSPRKAEHSEVIEALRAIGAIEQASISNAALEAIQNAGSGVLANYEDRFAASVDFSDLTEFDDAFERCARSFQKCLMEYLDKHEKEFIEWLP